MKSFLESMLSEGGKISHKRVISFMIAVVLAWAIVYAMLRASTAPERKTIIDGIMIFLLLVMGVTTVPQIISLIKGTPLQKEEDPKDAQ